MRTRLKWLGLVFMALSISWGCGSHASEELGRYVNLKNKFSMVLPSGWEKMSRPGMSVTVGTKKGTVVITVGLIKLGPLLTLEQFKDYFVGAYENASVAVVKQTKATLGGVSAYDILAEGLMGGSTGYLTTYIAVHGGACYSVSFTAPKADYDTYKPLFDQAIQSFRFEQ